MDVTPVPSFDAAAMDRSTDTRGHYEEIIVATRSICGGTFVLDAMSAVQVAQRATLNPSHAACGTDAIAESRNQAMLSLAAIPLTCWLCALLAIPRPPRPGDEIQELVYRRLIGRHLLLRACATASTLIAILALVLHALIRVRA